MRDLIEKLIGGPLTESPGGSIKVSVEDAAMIGAVVLLISGKKNGRATKADLRAAIAQYLPDLKALTVATMISDYHQELANGPGDDLD